MQEISFLWHDPEVEIRHGEIKKTGSNISLFHDSLPHCISIVSYLLPELPLQNIESSKLQNRFTTIKAKHQKIISNYSLSRTAHARVRRISVNNDELVLDFSVEPGHIIFNKTKIENFWKSAKPLSISFRKFIEIAEGRISSDEWPLNIKNFLDNVKLCQEAEFKLQDSN